MSLGIVIKAPEGLVLAAESRVTLTASQSKGRELLVNFDNATKLLSFNNPNMFIGTVTYGLASIRLRTAHSFLPEFEATLPPKKRLTVEDFAARLSDFFSQQWKNLMPTDYKGPSMVFVVAGFNENDPYGKVFIFEIPSKPSLTEKNPGGEFGLTWGGQGEFVNRLIQGYEPRLAGLISDALKLNPQQTKEMMKALKPLQMQIPLIAMPLQDCVDLAAFFIRTTIDAQRLTVGVRGCGGPIDLAIITRRDGLRFIQRKKITGETGEAIDIVRP